MMGCGFWRTRFLARMIAVPATLRFSLSHFGNLHDYLIGQEAVEIEARFILEVLLEHYPGDEDQLLTAATIRQTKEIEENDGQSSDQTERAAPESDRAAECDVWVFICGQNNG